MQVEIVQRAAAHILGIQIRINPMAADWNDIWRNQYDPRHPEIVALSGDAECYGVYYACDEPGKADLVAGMLVPEGVAVPAGLTLRPLPGGVYARIDCTLGELGAVWGTIYGQWLPSSIYDADESRPAMEVYDLESMGPQAPVQIYVAVKEK